MTGTSFIGLYAFQWIALLTAGLTSLLLADALAGHYRSGFTFRVQYAPFISGGLLIIAAVAAAVAPNVAWLNTALRGASWLAVASGLVGFGFHHYYGIVKKPGGYKWLLHYLMYGAPQLAPLALAIVGVLAVVAARGLAGEVSFAGLNMRAALLALVAVALAGAVLQATILHYRGAFNNPAMYAPLTAPLLAVVASIWMVVAPNSLILFALTILLWLTFLLGFIGLGMHLRGFERQMGGLYVSLFNLLEGPPAWAPALFAGFATVGLVTVRLL
ncbi:MAG: hypothetical protein DMF64_15395 [Acidobacteria bacterium]|nr:MAG: hypothetical protein DMF64_15395 [Acidobacteriota bacterium]